MSLTDKINEDIKQAMLKKEPKDKLEALRAIKAALIITKTEKAGVEITEEVELKILNKLVKQRYESADIYKTQNRTDLSEKELTEAKYIEVYLPTPLATKEIEAVIKEIIQMTGAKSPADMGKVMGASAKALSGKADGKVISEIVKRLLAG